MTIIILQEKILDKPEVQSSDLPFSSLELYRLELQGMAQDSYNSKIVKQRVKIQIVKGNYFAAYISCSEVIASSLLFSWRNSSILKHHSKISFCPVFVQKWFNTFSHVIFVRVFSHFPNKPLFTRLHYKSFEKTVGQGEIARYQQFLLFQKCFLPVWRTFCHFHQIYNCRLQTHLVWKT